MQCRCLGVTARSQVPDQTIRGPETRSVFSVCQCPPLGDSQGGTPVPTKKKPQKLHRSEVAFSTQWVQWDGVRPIWIQLSPFPAGGFRGSILLTAFKMGLRRPALWGSGQIEGSRVRTLKWTLPNTRKRRPRVAFFPPHLHVRCF